MTAQEIDSIECAIRHIQTAADIDPWAVEIAVDAMEKQIQKKPNRIQSRFRKNLWYLYCQSCKHCIAIWDSREKRCNMRNISNRNICPCCGQAIDWTEGE